MIFMFCVVLVQAEINYLGQLQHPNLIKLIGYCFEDDHRLLVYEFKPKGMENHVFRRQYLLNQLDLLISYSFSILAKIFHYNSEPLNSTYSINVLLKLSSLMHEVLIFHPFSWSLQMKISSGAAKGLHFLRSTKHKVIYHDFKTSNILLDFVCT